MRERLIFRFPGKTNIKKKTVLRAPSETKQKRPAKQERPQDRQQPHGLHTGEGAPRGEEDPPEEQKPQRDRQREKRMHPPGPRKIPPQRQQARPREPAPRAIHRPDAPERTSRSEKVHTPHQQPQRRLYPKQPKPFPPCWTAKFHKTASPGETHPVSLNARPPRGQKKKAIRFWIHRMAFLRASQATCRRSGRVPGRFGSRRTRPGDGQPCFRSRKH